MNRLHNWLVANEMTAVITAKLDWQRSEAVPWEEGILQYMPFIVDCVIVLTHQFENSFSQRRLRILKFRGSSFAENECAFIIGPSGLDVAPTDTIVPLGVVQTERVSTGVEPLDKMLGGGFLRGVDHHYHGRMRNGQDNACRRLLQCGCQTRGADVVYRF